MNKNELTPLAADLHLSRRERATLDRLTTVVDVPSGTLLCRQGEVPREAMIVLTGSVEVRRGGEWVAEVGPGDVIGELALIDGTPYRSADVTATSDVTIAVMSAREFAALRRTAPAFTSWVEGIASGRRSSL